MREFFYGWRRKVGCVTLAMGLVLLVGWMRTRVLREGLSLRCSQQLFYSIASHDGTLHLVRASYTPPLTGAPFIKWFSVPRPDNGQHITQMPTMRWRWQAAGFGVGHLTRPEVVFTFWIVPYWFPTGILTIVSAWLLLSKPRPRPQPTPKPGP
ncbi:MAG: hypothetical protein JWP89_4150 [Schlesneria sp.]|nr:hypothetical protein [Schlesneria sp.]